MASITTGSEQPCNHPCAYPKGAPARRQSAAGAAGRGEPLPRLPTAMQEVSHSPTAQCWLAVRHAEHPPPRQPAQPGAGPGGCWSSRLFESQSEENRQLP